MILFFPLDYVGSVISQQFDLIFNFPFFFFDLRLDEGGFQSYREIFQQYLRFAACKYLC